MNRYQDIINGAGRSKNGHSAPHPEPTFEVPPDVGVWTPEGYGDEPDAPRVPSIAPRMRTVRQLVTEHRELREPIIENLLRRGETANIIGAPKIGKSWAVTGLALCIQTGRRWLDRFDCVRGNVLVIDNELHGETSASRIPAVAAAMGIPDAEYADTLQIDNLRGRLVNIFEMATYFDSLEPRQFDVIILDAFYRFVPASASENDNATMARIYNAIDAYADRLGCAFVLIHHSSKGNQADKSVADVGSGAGAMSRAADAHIVMRAHEEDQCVVVDAVARSWAPIEPFALRWEFPVFKPDSSLNPEALKRARAPGEQRQQQKDREGIDAIVKALTANGPLSRTKLTSATGMDRRRLDRLLLQIDESIKREEVNVNGNNAEVISLLE